MSKQSELDEILCALQVAIGKGLTKSSDLYGSKNQAKQAILDWHNKRIEEVLDRLESERDSHDADTGCSDELGYIPLSAIEAERKRINKTKKQ